MVKDLVSEENQKQIGGYQFSISISTEELFSEVSGPQARIPL